MNYKFLRAWHQFNRAHGAEWTFELELKHACDTNAPERAVYYERGCWVTVDEIEDKGTQELILDIAGQM